VDTSEEFLVNDLHSLSESSADGSYISSGEFALPAFAGQRFIW